MTPGITTWDGLGSIDGNILLIVNSVEDRAAVEAVLGALAQVAARAALHVIAGPGWRQMLNDRGIPDERILVSVGEAGQALELNYFLEGPVVPLWVAARHFRVVIGSDAHSLHNDEVKELFEQRVCVLIGDGRFLAHTLPGEYVFVLDLLSLAERLDRDRKRAAYEATCRALVDDLYCAWRTRSQPPPSSDGPLEKVAEMLQKHLGEGFLAFDEIAAIAVDQASRREPIAKLGVHFRTMLCRHDQQRADLVRRMTDAYQERVIAVAERDVIIDTLRERLWLSRLRHLAAQWLKPR